MTATMSPGDIGAALQSLLEHDGYEIESLTVVRGTTGFGVNAAVWKDGVPDWVAADSLDANRWTYPASQVASALSLTLLPPLTAQRPICWAESIQSHRASHRRRLCSLAAASLHRHTQGRSSLSDIAAAPCPRRCRSGR